MRPFDKLRDLGLILVRCLHLAFDAQRSLGRIGVRHDREVTALETMMPRTVVCHLDRPRLARVDGFTRIVAHGAATTGAHLANQQGRVTGIGKVERIGHHLTLQQGAEVVFFFLKLDGGLLVRVLCSRLGTRHQIG